MKYKFGFIGAGNMGSALAAAVSKQIPCSMVAISDKDKEKASSLAKTLGVCTSDVRSIANESEYIVLGIKPQGIESVAQQIKDVIEKRENVTVITMLAGVSIATIRTLLGSHIEVIRIMPNTPVGVGEGVILYAASAKKPTEHEFTNAFSKAGLLARMNEDEIDTVTALTGCGPAFAFMFIDALAKGAVRCGVDPALAERLAAQTVLGSAKTVLEMGDPNRLKAAVCSPGGCTIEGVRALEENRFTDRAMEAVLAAYRRTLEMKK